MFSILHQSLLGLLVIGPFSPFAKPVHKKVKTHTRRHYTFSPFWPPPSASVKSTSNLSSGAATARYSWGRELSQ